MEFAILAPFLISLLVITTDFARVFYYQTTLNQCARNGALYGSALNSYQETTFISPYTTTATPSDDNIKTATIADGANLSPALTTSQVTVAHANGSDANAAVQVTISYPFSSLTGFPVFGTTFNLTAKASMRQAP